MQLTPDLLAAAYDLLKLTPPFKGWKLPESDDVQFSVIAHRGTHADWFYDGKHHIRVSRNTHNYLSSVLISVAHEVAHMRAYMVKPDERGEHGAEYHRAAKSICKQHGYDPGQF